MQADAGAGGLISAMPPNVECFCRSMQDEHVLAGN